MMVDGAVVRNGHEVVGPRLPAAARAVELEFVGEPETAKGVAALDLKPRDHYPPTAMSQSEASTSPDH